MSLVLILFLQNGLWVSEATRRGSSDTRR